MAHYTRMKVDKKQIGKRGCRKKIRTKCEKHKEISLDLLKCIEHSGKSTVFTNRIRPAGITNQRLLSKYRTSESHVNYQNWTADQLLSIPGIYFAR